MRGKKSKDRDKIKNLFEKYKDVLNYDSKNCKLKCTICNKLLNSRYESTIKRHLNSKVHALLETIKINNEKNDNTKRNFSKNIYQGFGSANVPLNTFKNTLISKTFKEIDINFPSVNTIRKKFLLDFDMLIGNLKIKWYQSDLFFILDETKKKEKILWNCCWSS